MEVKTAKHQQFQMVAYNVQFVSEYIADQVCFFDGKLNKAKCEDGSFISRII